MMKKLIVRAAAIAVFAGACGGPDSDNNPDGGLDPNGPCEPEALRCNGNDVEQCNIGGTMWEHRETCSAFCADGTCALDGLDVAADMTLDGIVHVAGEAIVRAGATLSTPTGDLTIFADTITIEAGGAVTATPTGETPDGRGSDYSNSCSFIQMEGGSYGSGARPWGSNTDSDVSVGSPGGLCLQSGGMPARSLGGGVIRLVAKQAIVIAGQVVANGANGVNDATLCSGNGGGSGGGILVVGDSVTVTGSLSTAGGVGAPTLSHCGTTPGLNGGLGRIKVLYGSLQETAEMTTNGVVTLGLAPPVPLRSATHPDPKLAYNDGFASLDLSWSRPFPSVKGYYVRLDQNPSSGPPTPANGNFQAAEAMSFSPNDVADGANYIHVVTVDDQSRVSTVETVFRVRINKSPPFVSSSSHPTQAFSINLDPFFQWEYPDPNNVTGVFYVFDSYGLTVPSTTDAMLPVTQKQILMNGVAPGVHVLHVVAMDKAGRLTKSAGHYRVNLGPDPGEGFVQGTITGTGAAGATVTLNRGLYQSFADGSGRFNFGGTNVTAGTWELLVTAGAQSVTKTITVNPGVTTEVAVALP